MVALPFPLSEHQNDQFKQVKVKTKEDSDCKYVIRLCDAEECLDETANSDPGAVIAAILDNVRRLMLDQLPESPLGAYAEKVKVCMQENRLRQDTLRRKTTTKTGYHRPSKGHGKGRGSI
jgi:hypothetical protein